MNERNEAARCSGRGALTGRWINIYDEQELGYWARRLKVERKQIVTAVHQVGANPAEVRKWLQSASRRRSRHEFASRRARS
jgi:hypothetical protein